MKRREIISKEKKCGYWDCQIKYSNGTQMHALLSDSDVKISEIENFLYKRLKEEECKKVMEMINEYGSEKYLDGSDAEE